MSARSRRRRARAEALPQAATDGSADGARPKRRVPALPLLAGAAGLVLIGSAAVTRLSPGAAQAPSSANHFTVEIPADEQRVVNSWQRFFICYDLTDREVIERTLRANQRATGSLDFPGEKVEVELPTAGDRSAGAGSGTAGAEDDVLRLSRSVQDAIAQGGAQARQQCAGGAPA